MAAVFCQGHQDTPENISAREYLDIWSQIIRSMQIIHYQLREQLLAKSMDPPPNPSYIERPLWAQTLIKLSMKTLSRKKSQYPLPKLEAEAERAIAIITPGNRTYITHGSVDPTTHTVSAGLTARDNTTYIRVTVPDRSCCSHGSPSPCIPMNTKLNT